MIGDLLLVYARLVLGRWCQRMVLFACPDATYSIIVSADVMAVKTRKILAFDQESSRAPMFVHSPMMGGDDPGQPKHSIKRNTEIGLSINGFWALGAAVAQLLYTEKVTGSNPVAPTNPMPSSFNVGNIAASGARATNFHRQASNPVGAGRIFNTPNPIPIARR